MNLDFEYRGIYFTSFFSIFINGDFELNLNNLNKKDLGTFVHEYCHYIQNVDTLLGLSNSQFFYIFISELRQFLNTQNSISLPLNDFELSEITLKNKKNFDNHKGDNANIDLDNIENISIEESNDKILINLSYENGKSNKVHYGSLHVKEGMAHHLQKYFDPEVEHNSIYLMTELLCENVNPQLLINEEYIILLSYLSLNSINSGKAMFQNVKKSLEYPNLNPFDLYIKLRDNTFITINNVKYSNSQAKTVVLNAFKDTMAQSLLSELKYFNKVFKNIDLVNKGETKGFSEIITNTEFENIDLIKLLTGIYGLPSIYTNTELKIIDNNSTEHIELIGQLLVLDRLLEQRGTTVCNYIHICQNDSEIKIDDNCYGTQWLRTENCPFLVTSNHWNLKDKIKAGNNV